MGGVARWLKLPATTDARVAARAVRASDIGRDVGESSADRFFDTSTCPLGGVATDCNMESFKRPAM